MPAGGAVPLGQLRPEPGLARPRLNLANGWLYEVDRRFYLGPAVYSLTLASGHIRAGLVTLGDLAALHEEARAAVFLGVQARDHLVYVAEVGSEGPRRLRGPVRHPPSLAADGRW